MRTVTKVMERCETHPWLGVMLLWLAALSLLVLCSFNTSILNPFYGGDAHYFTTTGRMTAQGALPFAEIYDHKGALVFYIHALGFLISPGKSGILLLQSLALAASMLLTYRICRLWGTATQSLAGLAMFAALYAACLWGGDMTEEYSLPLALLPSYIILRDLMQGRNLRLLSNRAMFLAGACIGLIAMLRLNNAAPVCGVLIGLAGCMQSKWDVFQLVRLALVTILGVCAALLPFAAYFAAHDALDDMLMGTFIHNYYYALGYTAERTVLENLGVGLKVSALPLFLLTLIIGRKQLPCPRGAWGAWVGFAAFSLLIPACGQASSHYFIMAAPAIGLTLVLFLRSTAERPRLWCTLAFTAILLLPFAMDAAHLAAGFRRYNIIRNYQEEIDAARRIADSIPANERDSVWACDVHASIYVYGRLTPCCPYFTMQSDMARFNPHITPAIAEMMTERPPRWIIVKEGTLSDQPDVQRALRSGAYSLHLRESHALHLDLWKRN